MPAPKKCRIYNLKFKKSLRRILHSTFNIQHSQKGFSLVEIMVAISIIAVITAVGAMSFSKSQSLARDAKRKQDLRSIAVALELYYQKNKHYPCATVWQSSTSGNNWITDTASAGANCGAGGANQDLAPTYITATPKDPKNTAGDPKSPSSDNFSYGYFSGPYQNCGTGTGYWLTTRLENSGDPDSYAKKGDTPCGLPFNSTTLNGYSGNIFNISVYN